MNCNVWRHRQRLFTATYAMLLPQVLLLFAPQYYQSERRSNPVPPAKTQVGEEGGVGTTALFSFKEPRMQ